MDDKTFLALKSEIDAFVIFDEAKIEEILVTIPKMYQRLADHFTYQMYEYNKLRNEFDALIGELFKQYKFNDKFTWANKQEIEIRMKTDAQYISANHKIIKQKFIVDYLEQSMNNVKNMGFNVKHWVDYKKFMTGMG